MCYNYFDAKPQFDWTTYQAFLVNAVRWRIWTRDPKRIGRAK